MKHRCAFALGFLFFNLAFAQVDEELQLGTTCSYFGEEVPESVFLFRSESDAESVIESIVSVSGLQPNFKVQAAGVPNASAMIKKGERMILYNQYFVRQMSKISHWTPIIIMAHEIGHHLNGHTLSDLGSRPRIELEADHFSGFISQKLGAELDQTRVTWEKSGSYKASKTHPAKHDRLAAITNGWLQACEQDVNCRDKRPVLGKEQTTATGLTFKAIRIGDGPFPLSTDRVFVHYVLKLMNGAVVQTSFDYGTDPMIIPVNKVISGWQEGLVLMPVGSVYHLIVPPSLAYGAEGSFQIPPNATLKYEIALCGIEGKTTNSNCPSDYLLSK